MNSLAPSENSCVKFIKLFEFDDSFKRFVVEVNTKKIRSISEYENITLQDFIDNEYKNRNCFENRYLKKIDKDIQFELKFNGIVINIREFGQKYWNLVIVTNKNYIEGFLKKKYDDFVKEVIFIHGCEKSNESNFNNRLAMRSISTYGYTKHYPKVGHFDYYLEKYIYGDEYIIKKISNGVIPNQKPRCTESNNKNTFLTLEPKKGLKKNERVFWFVDQTNKTINQYEDGYILENLKQIVVCN